MFMPLLLLEVPQQKNGSAATAEGCEEMYFITAVQAEGYAISMGAPP